MRCFEKWTARELCRVQIARLVNWILMLFKEPMECYSLRRTLLFRGLMTLRAMLAG